MRRNDLTPEQIEDVKRDLVAGKTRGQICKDRGYSYVQLQRAPGIGFAWKKGQKEAEPVVEQIVEPEPIN